MTSTRQTRANYTYMATAYVATADEEGMITVITMLSDDLIVAQIFHQTVATTWGSSR